MHTSQWPQGNQLVKPMEEGDSTAMLERRARPQKDQALNCPRCNSTNTKFCYYNNYSLTQPRYFCKTCRRYWTEGGSLRNVPVGGGSRKNKRPTSSSSAATKKINNHDGLNPPNFSLHMSSSQNPKVPEGQDLNLAFPPHTEDIYSNSISHNPNSSSHISAMELLKSGISSRGLNSFMTPIHANSSIYSSGFNLQDIKPIPNFPVEGFEGGYCSTLQGVQENNSGAARLLFPFQDLKQVPSTTAEFEQNRGQGDSNGYWNGMLGGGSW